MRNELSKSAKEEPLKHDDILKSRYGNVREGDVGYNLAASVWGHRLRVGQHWMEYLLEFLNVFAGFESQLGQGVTTGEPNSPDRERYKKFQRVGLRRFVFYDEREKTRHPYDDEAWQRLQSRLEDEVLLTQNGLSDYEALDMVRSLFRSFSAVEAKRSWYAKSLFPAHKNLLFWEATRKGATKRRGSTANGEVGELDAEELDDDVRYDQRNFFARGGEVYYLILSAGTKDNAQQRELIEKGIRNLVSGQNRAIGQLAEIIDDTWKECYGGETEENDTGTLGWIPNPDDPFYRKVAEDVATFLRADLDPLEALTLFAHLICFHLSLFIYKRAECVLRTIETDGLNNVESPFLIDMLTDSSGNNTLRRVSVSLFKAREAEIEKCGRVYVQAKVREWCERFSRMNLEETVQRVDKEAENHFGLSRLRSTDKYERRIDQFISKAQQGDMELKEFCEQFAEELTTLLMSDFGKNFLPVHRKLTKSIRFVAPRKGPSARFVLGDDLLKAVTLSNVPFEMTFDRFLDRLFERYEIVVGAQHARESGLFAQQRINSEYYDRNREVMLDRMKHAGLAQVFSDATTMVRPVHSV